MMKRIAVFASGSGTNAENICRYFSGSDEFRVVLILTNNPEAGVVARAQNAEVPCLIFNREEFGPDGKVVQSLELQGVDLIVLAGFLWLVPKHLIDRYRGRIINIHPALLPSFGGKGFYGDKVHRAVIESHSIISGISVHQVNEHFDEGDVIFQAACHVAKDETPESLAKKVHALEYRYFPVVIEKYFSTLPPSI